MPKGGLMPLARSAVSYVPSSGLLALRRLGDLPRRLRRRPHEADFEALRRVSGRGLLVVDVGANRGQSIASLRTVLDRPRIVAFEPNPALADRLRREAGDDVTVHAVALGEAPGAFDLHVPCYGNTRYDTRATLDATTATAFLEPGHFAGYRPARATVVTEPVEVRRLDDFDLAPDLVKIDVEGTVPGVIRGAAATIERSRPVFLVEEGGDETADLLAAHGYEPAHHVAGTDTLAAGPGSLNTFYLLPEHRDRPGLGVDRPS